MPDDPPAIEVSDVKAIPPDFGDADIPPPAAKPATVSEGSSDQVQYVERNEDTEIILELVLDDGQTILDSGVVGYLIDETVLLPLGKFTELLGFPITVDTSKGAAEGWFIRQDNTFKLYAPYKTIEIAGKKIPLNQQGIAETHLDDIYVSQDLLTSWFPVELTLNYGELRLYMKTLVDLPFQERAKRKSRREASTASTAQPGVDYDPADIIRLPYKFYSAPSIEISHGYNHSRNATGSVSGTSHSLNAEGDLFNMDGRLSLGYLTSTGARDEIQGTMFTLSKEDFEGKLLGPLRATHYQLGDITTGSFPLTGAQQGRGFNLDNEPYNFVRDANNFRIEGFGPVGWDVEVFQDLEIIAFAEIGNDGRYTFETLPLGEGFNIFKIVLYGPNGEKEEKYERFYLGQNMVEQGKFIYNASALQSSTPIFNFGVTQPDETEHTLSMVGEYGLTSYLSTSAGYYHGPIADTALDGIGIGVRASGGRAYSQMNAFFDKSGGTSSSVLITGNFTDTIGFNMQHRRDDNYPIPYYPTVRNTTAQVTKLFDFANELLPDIGLTLGGGREEENTGREKNLYQMRLSTNFMGLSLTNEIERAVYSDTSEDTHEGRLAMRYRTGIGILRADVNYGFRDPFEVKTGLISLQSDLSEFVSLTNSIDHAFDNPSRTTFSSSLDWKLEKVRLGLRGSIDNQDNKQIGVSVNYNLVPQSQYGDYTFANRTDDIGSGRLVLRPFVDKNGDGIWNEGETVLEGLSFRNMLRGSLSTPTPDNLYLLPGLSPGLANRITVDEKSIPDIYLTPTKKEIVVLGKRGVNGPIDFAFTRLGEISGTLVGVDAFEQEVPLDAIHMILLGADGKQVADTYSEFDGYFSFDAIPTGHYEIFFPASETLMQYYSGTGEGPQTGIDFDNPENTLKIRIEKDKILITDSADLEKTTENEKLLDGGKQSSLPLNTSFFAMKLK